MEDAILKKLEHLARYMPFIDYLLCLNYDKYIKFGEIKHWIKSKKRYPLDILERVEQSILTQYNNLLVEDRKPPKDLIDLINSISFKWVDLCSDEEKDGVEDSDDDIEIIAESCPLKSSEACQNPSKTKVSSETSKIIASIQQTCKNIEEQNQLHSIESELTEKNDAKDTDDDIEIITESCPFKSSDARQNPSKKNVSLETSKIIACIQQTCELTEKNDAKETDDDIEIIQQTCELTEKNDAKDTDDDIEIITESYPPKSSDACQNPLKTKFSFEVPGNINISIKSEDSETMKIIETIEERCKNIEQQNQLDSIESELDNKLEDDEKYLRSNLDNRNYTTEDSEKPFKSREDFVNIEKNSEIEKIHIKNDSVENGKTNPTCTEVITLDSDDDGDMENKDKKAALSFKSTPMVTPAIVDTESIESKSMDLKEVNVPGFSTTSPVSAVLSSILDVETKSACTNIPAPIVTDSEIIKTATPNESIPSKNILNSSRYENLKIDQLCQAYDYLKEKSGIDLENYLQYLVKNLDKQSSNSMISDKHATPNETNYSSSSDLNHTGDNNNAAQRTCTPCVSYNSFTLNQSHLYSAYQYQTHQTMIHPYFNQQLPSVRKFNLNDPRIIKRLKEIVESVQHSVKARQTAADLSNRIPTTQKEAQEELQGQKQVQEDLNHQEEVQDELKSQKEAQEELQRQKEVQEKLKCQKEAQEELKCQKEAEEEIKRRKVKENRIIEAEGIQKKKKSKPKTNELKKLKQTSNFKEKLLNALPPHRDKIEGNKRTKKKRSSTKSPTEISNCEDKQYPNTEFFEDNNSNNSNRTNIEQKEKIIVSIPCRKSFCETYETSDSSTSTIPSSTTKRTRRKSVCENKAKRIVNRRKTIDINFAIERCESSTKSLSDTDTFDLESLQLEKDKLSDFKKSPKVLIQRLRKSNIPKHRTNLQPLQGGEVAKHTLEVPPVQDDSKTISGKSKIVRVVESKAKPKCKRKNTDSEMTERNTVFCVLCRSKSANLTHHYIRNHKTEPYTSRLTRSQLDSLHLNVPIAIAAASQYKVKCFFCDDYLVDSFINLYNHYSTHTGEYAFQCSSCALLKPFLVDIQSHQHHSKPCRNTPIKNLCLYQENFDAIYLYCCRICNFVQLNEANVFKHLRNHHHKKHYKPTNVQQYILVKSCNGKQSDRALDSNYIEADPSFELNANKKVTVSNAIICEKEVNVAEEIEPDIETLLMNMHADVIPEASEVSLPVAAAQQSVADANVFQSLSSPPVTNNSAILPITSITNITDNNRPIHVPKFLPLEEEDIKPDIEKLEAQLRSLNETSTNSTNTHQPAPLLRNCIAIQSYKTYPKGKAFFGLHKCMVADCFFSSNIDEEMLQHLKNSSCSAKDGFLDCSYCQLDAESFNSPEMLINHTREKHRHNRFQCPRCSYRSCMPGNVVIHCQHVHHNEENAPNFVYECEGQATILNQQSAQEIETHMSENVQKLPCPHCSKCFYAIESMTEHLKKVYNGVIIDINAFNRYACIHCTESSNDDAYMQKHLALKHPDKVPYVCERVLKPGLEIDSVNNLEIRNVTLSVLPRSIVSVNDFQLRTDSPFNTILNSESHQEVNSFEKRNVAWSVSPKGLMSVNDSQPRIGSPLYTIANSKGQTGENNSDTRNAALSVTSRSIVSVNDLQQSIGNPFNTNRNSESQHEVNSLENRSIALSVSPKTTVSVNDMQPRMTSPLYTIPSSESQNITSPILLNNFDTRNDALSVTPESIVSVNDLQPSIGSSLYTIPSSESQNVTSTILPTSIASANDFQPCMGSSLNTTLNSESQYELSNLDTRNIASSVTPESIVSVNDLQPSIDSFLNTISNSENQNEINNLERRNSALPVWPESIVSVNELLSHMDIPLNSFLNSENQNEVNNLETRNIGLALTPESILSVNDFPAVNQKEEKYFGMRNVSLPMSPKSIESLNDFQSCISSPFNRMLNSEESQNEVITSSYHNESVNTETISLDLNFYAAILEKLQHNGQEVKPNLKQLIDINIEVLKPLLIKLTANTGVSSDVLYRCPKTGCNGYFSIFKHWSRHMVERHHSIITACPHCVAEESDADDDVTAELPLTDFEQHFEQHRRHSFLCFHCGETYTNEKRLREHAAGVHAEINDLRMEKVPCGISHSYHVLIDSSLEMNKLKFLLKLRQVLINRLKYLETMESERIISQWVVPSTASFLDEFPCYLPDSQQRGNRCMNAGCSFSAFNIGEMLAHIRANHVVPAMHYYQCPRCTFRSDSPIWEPILEHMQMHNSNLYICCVCSYYHFDQNNISQHIRATHDSRDVAVLNLLRSSEETKMGIGVVYSTTRCTFSTMNNCFCCPASNLDPGTLGTHLKKEHKFTLRYFCEACHTHLPKLQQIEEHFTSKHPLEVIKIRCELASSNQLTIDTVMPLRVQLKGLLARTTSQLHKRRYSNSTECEDNAEEPPNKVQKTNTIGDNIKQEDIDDDSDDCEIIDEDDIVIAEELKSCGTKKKTPEAQLKCANIRNLLSMKKSTPPVTTTSLTIPPSNALFVSETATMQSKNVRILSPVIPRTQTSVFASNTGLTTFEGQTPSQQQNSGILSIPHPLNTFVGQMPSHQQQPNSGIHSMAHTLNSLVGQMPSQQQNQQQLNQQQNQQQLNQQQNQPLLNQQQNQQQQNSGFLSIHQPWGLALQVPSQQRPNQQNQNSDIISIPHPLTNPAGQMSSQQQQQNSSIISITHPLNNFVGQMPSQQQQMNQQQQNSGTFSIPHPLNSPAGQMPSQQQQNSNIISIPQPLNNFVGQMPSQQPNQQQQNSGTLSIPHPLNSPAGQMPSQQQQYSSILSISQPSKSFVGQVSPQQQHNCGIISIPQHLNNAVGQTLSQQQPHQQQVLSISPIPQLERSLQQIQPQFTSQQQLHLHQQKQLYRQQQHQLQQQQIPNQRLNQIQPEQLYCDVSTTFSNNSFNQQLTSNVAPTHQQYHHEFVNYGSPSSFVANPSTLQSQIGYLPIQSIAMNTPTLTAQQEQSQTVTNTVPISQSSSAVPEPTMR